MKGGGPTVTTGQGRDRASTTTSTRSRRARASSAGWPAPATCRSATTRTPRSPPRCSSRHPTAARMVLAGDNALREADGSITLLGPRLAVHQLGRREDLPGGGRAGAQGAPRRVRRHRRRGARRALGPAGRRRRPAPRRAELRRSRSSTPTAGEHVAGYKVPREVHLRRRGGSVAERQARLPLGEAGCHGRPLRLSRRALTRP